MNFHTGIGQILILESIWDYRWEIMGGVNMAQMFINGKRHVLFDQGLLETIHYLSYLISVK